MATRTRAEIIASAEGKQSRSVCTEVRVAAGDEFALVGYATLFNNLSHNLGGFRESIKPGTFSRSLKAGADVKCLFNHAADNILGRTKSGTLTVSEDARGLRFRCQLDKSNTQHNDIYSAVKRGDIDECSFAFTVAPGGQQWDSGKDPETGEDCLMRTLTDVDLLDVSVVTYPAYPNTSAGARNQRGKRSNDTGVKPSAVAIQSLRKAARLMAKAFRGTFGESADSSCNGHKMATDQAAFAHQMAESASAAFQQARSFWNDPSDDDFDYDDPDFNEDCRMAAAHLDSACERMASAALHHARITTKK